MLIGIFILAGVAVTAWPRLRATASRVPTKPAVNQGANAALIYWRAFALMPRRSKYLLHIEQSPSFSFLTIPLDKQIRQLDQSAQRSLRLLQHGAELVNCHWGLGISRFGISVQIPELAKAIQLTNWGILDARIAIADHHFNRAIRDYSDGIMLAHAIGRDKTIIGTLVEYSIRRFYLNRMLADNLAKLPAPALNHLAAVLSRLPAPTPFSYGFNCDNQDKIAWLKRLIRTGRTYQFIKLSEYKKWLSEYKWGPAFLSKLKSKSRAYWLQQARESIHMLEPYNERGLRAMALPYPQSIAAVEKLPSNSSLYTSSPGNVADLFIGVPKQGYALQFLVIAQTAMLRAAVAYLRGGRKAFDAVKDPFGKGPFIYYKMLWPRGSTGQKMVIQSALNVQSIEPDYYRPITHITFKLK